MIAGDDVMPENYFYGMDFGADYGCMVVAHVDVAGCLVIDEVVTAERNDKLRRLAAVRWLAEHGRLYIPGTKEQT